MPDKRRSRRERTVEIIGVVPPLTNIRAHRYEAGMAAAGIARALIFFFWPDTLSASAVGHALRPFDVIWNLMYILGGLGVLAGLCMDHKVYRGVQGVAVELAGLICFSTALVVQTYAILTQRGHYGLLGIILILGFLLPSIDRISSIWSAERKLVFMPVGIRRARGGD